jgi:hypothetical protein
MTAKTSETLALALEAIGLTTLAAKARTDEYHDYLSPHALPDLMLVTDLLLAAQDCEDGSTKMSILLLRQRAISGDFDASREESDEWARSPDGVETFTELFMLGDFPKKEGE